MSKDHYIYYRLGASSLCLVLYVWCYMSYFVKAAKNLPEHPDLQLLIDLGPRYYTIWNVTFQVIYLLVALISDISLLVNNKSLIPWGFRNEFFANILFPCNTSVLTFWAYYFYAPELMVPPKSDLLVTFWHQLMYHFGVFLYVLWELAFLPRDTPRRPQKFFKWISIVVGSYIYVLFYTRYVDLGVWCYIVMEKWAGTILFCIPILFPTVIAFVAYYTQWLIKDAVWKYRDGSLKEKSSE